MTSPGEIDEGYGQRYGRPDLDRVGFFDDNTSHPFGTWEGKPIQLRDCLLPGHQISCNLTGDLFQKQVRRIFTGEVLVGLGPKKKRGYKEPIPTGIIRPPGGNKKHSCPGDFYGCIGRQPKAFSPELKTMPQKQSMPRNFQTNPNPVGGPGYLKITINPYVPRYDGVEPYEPEVEIQAKADGRLRTFVTTCLPRKYFDDNPYRVIPVRGRKHKAAPKPSREKRPSFWTVFPHAPFGPNSGCFDKFPVYLPQLLRQPKGRLAKPEVIWNPGGGPNTRSKYSTSVIERVTTVSCNSQNFREYHPQVFALH